MEAIPKRPRIASYYRGVLSWLEKYLPLPKINPSCYELIGLFLSFVYLYFAQTKIRAVLLAAILVSDWLDGATARRYFSLSREGYMIDVFSDRISEMIIFFPIDGTVLSWGFFLAAMVNTILAYVSVVTQKHKSLALRFLFLLVLIYQLWK